VNAHRKPCLAAPCNPERGGLRRRRTRLTAGRALRRGDWKYYQDAKDDHLYNLAADSREQADLALGKPELLADLRAAWERIAGTLLPDPAS
jgi:arylsulfatase A-like enzyme